MTICLASSRFGLFLPKGPAIVALVGALGLAGCDSGNNGGGQADQQQGQVPGGSAPAAQVDSDRLTAADTEPGQWMSYNRTYSEQRFSPLDQITDTNIEKLGMAWHVDLETSRGQEATPIVVDGVMYVSTAWSMVKALDAETGEILWEYDPQVDKAKTMDACCGPVNRGVAVWKGKVFVGAFDGRLIALDAETGRELWSTMTVPEDMPYTITGAPRVVKDKVIIGNAGAEYAVRGYVTAYDTETGEQEWRFYTVPGNPEDGFENPALEKAAETWRDEWWEVGGGGGTVWDAMAYDPELDLLYIGVGNGGPHDRSVRSPGGGTNLYVGSIVALDPDTGEYVWHFQETPGDSWDYTSTQHMILADLEIGGETRKVILHAPKNGFFYVIDRETGEFISGEKYAKVNWAEGLDEDGKPIVNPEAWYGQTGEAFLGYPGVPGAHNWNPMSYSPDTGLAYIPAQNTPIVFNAGASDGYEHMLDVPRWEGFLTAWDPVAQEEVWRVDHAGAGNGGTLATAGNLVFQGTANGAFAAYQAETGEELWSTDVQSGVIAGPMSYTVDGEQYVALAVGWGGGAGLISGPKAIESGPKRNISRIVAFKLGGTDELPPPAPLKRTLNPPPSEVSEKVIAQGNRLYHRHCASCHGFEAISGGVLPDLRYSSYLNNFSWYDIVVRGALQSRGMVSFGNIITRDEATAIREYVIARANESKTAEDSGESNE